MEARLVARFTAIDGRFDGMQRSVDATETTLLTGFQIGHEQWKCAFSPFPSWMLGWVHSKRAWPRLS
jgi:hypothetical protein